MQTSDKYAFELYSVKLPNIWWLDHIKTAGRHFLEAVSKKQFVKGDFLRQFLKGGF